MLEYTDEPMSLDVFNKLSIHYIEENARQIDVIVNDSNRRHTSSKRTRQIPCTEGEALTEEEKARYHFKESLYGMMKWIMDVANRLSESWECPFRMPK